MVSGTEKEVLIAVAEQKKASKSEITRKVGITIDYVDLICKALIRKGYLLKINKGYMLTKEGEDNISFSVKNSSSVLVKNSKQISKESIKDLTVELANKVASKVVAEINTKAIENKPVEKIIEDKSTEKQKIYIKTDFDFSVEDETLSLETNIDKVEIETKKEKFDIDKSIDLLKGVQKNI